MADQPKEIPLTPVESSNVEAIGYDPESKRARVRYRGGATYIYEGVEPELFQVIQTAPSIGKAIGSLKRLPTTKETPPAESTEQRLKRLAELEDGCDISVGGLMVDLAKAGAERKYSAEGLAKLYGKSLPLADDSGSVQS